MKLKSKTAFITGATSGIGRACALNLAQQGCRVILIGRRSERLEKLGQEIKRKYNGEWLALPLDVRNKEAVRNAIDSLPEYWRDIDILINNAGMARGVDKMQQASAENWEQMIDTNVKGLLYVTHALLPGMVKRQKGDIVNIGSTAGHEVYPGGNVYCATKHAVDAITKGLRIDLVDTPLRVASVDPGMVETEFSIVRLGDEQKAKDVYSGMQPLTAHDIAETVVFILTRPAHVQFGSVIMLPTAQASAMVVHRE